MTSKCISELLDLGLQVRLQTGSITAFKCITESNSIAASKYISHVHTITASECISMFSQSASPGAPVITLQSRLKPDWPHGYI
jgi:hypothetical protein